MAAVIGALRVVLGADTAALDKGLKEARSSLSSFGSSIATAGAAAAAAFTAAFAGVAYSIANTLKHMDELGKTSQKIGIPTEELSALKLAADLSDVSIEALTKSVGKLSKNMVEAAGKPTSEAANAFKALGVSVTDSDGKLKGAGTILSDVAGKFEGLKDGAGKTAVSMAIFGKSGADLIPLLNSGKQGIEDMKKEAEELGITFSTQTAKAAEQFRDNLTRLSAAKDGIITKISIKLLPLLVQLSERLVALAKSDLTGWAGTVGRVIVGVIEQFQLMTARIENFGRTWEAFKTWMGTVPFTDASTKAWEKFNGIVEENRKTMQGIRDTNAYSLLADAFGPIATKSGEAGKQLKEFNYQAMAGKNALDQFLASQAKSLAGQEAELQADEKATGVKEGLKVKLQGLQVAQENLIKVTPAYTAKLNEASAAAETMGLKLGNISLIGETNPFAKLQANLDLTNEKLAAGGLKMTDYAMLSEQAGKLQTKVWTEASSSFGSSADSIGNSLSTMNSSWARAAKVGKAIAATVAFINSYVAASEALAKAVFPANIAIAAGVLANGLAMVAAIKSAAVPSAAMGGAFQVPGGYGGGDKVFAPMMLEPGELVEVSSNRQGGYNSGGGNGERTLSLSVKGETFGRETLRTIAKGIEELVGDGLRINLEPT